MSNKYEKIAIVYRDFRLVNPNFSHVGLGVNAAHTKAVLDRHGVDCLVFGLASSAEIAPILIADPTISVCIIEAAVWCWETTLEALAKQFPDVQFVVRLHSNLAFLAVEPSAFKSLRSTLKLSEKYNNISLGTNSRHIVNWVASVYAKNALYLPNLYDLKYERKSEHKRKPGHLDIGSFGALRVPKNHTTNAAVAQMVARRLGCTLDFHINSQREEHGQGVLASLTEMFRDVPGMRLIQDPWCDWKDFRKLVGSMDLNLQLSHTETFNLVSADSVMENVPIIVSPSIEWAPQGWKVDPDRVGHAAYIGSCLLLEGAAEGKQALSEFIHEGTGIWLDFLTI